MFSYGVPLLGGILNIFDCKLPNVNLKRRNLDVMEPSLPRKCKRPPCYEVGNAEAEFHETVEDQYCQIYYQAFDPDQALDTVVGTI